MSYWKLKAKSTLLLILNAIIFLIPLIIMVIIYKEDFINTKSATGLAGLGIIGIVIYICGLKHALGKFPTITWFIIVLLICIFADYVSEFLVKISTNMLIGYILTIPLTIYTKKLNKNADTVDDIVLREKYNSIKENSKDDNYNNGPDIYGRV